MNEILITTRKELIDFLKKDDLNMDVMWKCPKCGEIVHGAYYSRAVPCPHCDDFIFPAMSMKELMREEKEADLTRKATESLRNRIRFKREVISVIRTDLYEEEESLKELIADLKDQTEIEKKETW